MSDAKDRLLLSGFLKFMGLDRNKIVSGKLENRIKAQKFVYFGKKLGLPLSYDFDLYLYGPYSTELADDYYNMSEDEWKSGTIDVPESIEKALHYLRGNDALFLEIAATLDSIRTVNSGVGDNKLIDVVSKLKSTRLSEKSKDRNYLRDVLSELSNHNIF
jgi:uncharacterized protein YwgA